MWSCEFTVKDADGNPVKFVLAKDLSAHIIGEVMEEPLDILMKTGHVFRAKSKWHVAMAARIIREPRKYRDGKDEVNNLPWKSALELFAKIDEIYPFHECVPPEYKEPVRKWIEEWNRMVRESIEEWKGIYKDLRETYGKRED